MYGASTKAATPTAPIASSSATINNGANVTTYVGNSKLEGNAVQNAGTIKCVGSYNATYDLLNNSTCLKPLIPPLGKAGAMLC